MFELCFFFFFFWFRVSLCSLGYPRNWTLPASDSQELGLKNIPQYQLFTLFSNYWPPHLHTHQLAFVICDNQSIFTCVSGCFFLISTICSQFIVPAHLWDSLRAPGVWLCVTLPYLHCVFPLSPRGWRPMPLRVTGTISVPQNTSPEL